MGSASEAKVDFRKLYFRLLRDALRARRWYDDPDARGSRPSWPKYLAEWVLAGAERDMKLSREQVESLLSESDGDETSR